MYSKLINSLSFCRFTVSLAYYSLYLMSSMLSKDRFLDFFLYAVAEIPSQIVLWYLVRRYVYFHHQLPFSDL